MHFVVVVVAFVVPRKTPKRKSPHQFRNSSRLIILTPTGITILDSHLVLSPQVPFLQKDKKTSALALRTKRKKKRMQIGKSAQLTLSSSMRAMRH